MMVKNVVVTVVLGVTLFLLTVIGVTMYFVPKYDVTEEYGQTNVQKSVSGTWVHTNTLCRGMVDYEGIVEYTFGEKLAKETVNPIHLDKYDNTLTEASIKDREWVTAWINDCEHVENIESDETIVSIEHDNYLRVMSFLFVPERDLLLANDDEGILNFVPKDRLLGLPKYIAKE